MIVYTLETLGLLQNERNFSNLWSDPQIMLKAMQLSVALAAKKETPVIYTDAIGLELCTLLKLPCEVVLTKFPDYPRDIFGLSKLHVFSLQTQPFTSLDFDAFVLNWDGLTEGFTSFCREHPYEGNPYYYLNWFKNPWGLSVEEEWQPIGTLPYVHNLGFYHCPDLEINRKHVEVAFRFYQNNKNKIDSFPKGIRSWINIIVDQYTLSSLLRDYHVHVCQDGLECRLDANVVHLMGATKQHMQNVFWLNNLHREMSLPDFSAAWDFWDDLRKKNSEK